MSLPPTPQSRPVSAGPSGHVRVRETIKLACRCRPRTRVIHSAGVHRPPRLVRGVRFLITVRPSSDARAAVLAGIAMIACMVAVCRRRSRHAGFVHFAVSAAVGRRMGGSISGSLWAFALKQTAVFFAVLVATVTGSASERLRDPPHPGGGAI
jgi:hypothetical protein